MVRYYYKITIFTERTGKVETLESTAKFALEDDCYKDLLMALKEHTEIGQYIEPQDDYTDNIKQNVTNLCECLIDKLEWDGHYFQWSIHQFWQFSVYKFHPKKTYQAFHSCVFSDQEQYNKALLDYWNKDEDFARCDIADQLLSKTLPYYYDGTRYVGFDSTRAIEYYEIVSRALHDEFKIIVG